jgi:hypothetical protein
VVVTDGLAMGLLHTVTAVHAGFGPEGGTVEGPVSSTVDLRKATTVTNSTLQLKMKPIFGKVKSSNITVEGKLFPDFYRDTFVPGFPKFHPTIRIQGVAQLSFPAPRPNFDPLQFNKLFNDIPKWAGAPEITIEEFVAVFLIFANETGGSFKPIAERGSLAHMFYLNNKGGNRPAGDQLRDRGIVTDPAAIAAWNAVGHINPRTNQCDNFPGTSPGGPTDADVAECDFDKYRGRDFVQLHQLSELSDVPRSLAQRSRLQEERGPDERRARRRRVESRHRLLRDAGRLPEEGPRVAGPQQLRTVAPVGPHRRRAEQHRLRGSVSIPRRESLRASHERARAGQLDLK